MARSNKIPTELPAGLGTTCHQHHPSVWRKHAFDVAEQLNLLYDDIQEGRFGEAAQSGAFAQYVRKIKDQYPKV